MSGTKETKQSTKTPKKSKFIETEPSSWDRFKRAIHKIAPPKKVKPKIEKPD